jgi:antibiotic biosynthesis monooxygenase (ABM) superfamily enzyme
MPWKTRLVLVLAMSGVMVTLLVTCLNPGLQSDFALWVKAYFTVWSIVALTGYFIMPSARHLNDRIVAHLDGIA